MVSLSVLGVVLVLLAVGQHRTRVGHDVDYLLTGISSVFLVVFLLVGALVALDVLK